MSTKNGFLWIDVAGTELTSEDKEILAHPKISGVILFSKNFESKSQLKSLTKSILKIDPSILITVDQEGGRVQRFREGFTELPSLSHWGERCEKSPQTFESELFDIQTKQVNELRDSGVYASLSPVLDINYNRNEVIGERSFGNNAEIVTNLGRIFIKNMHKLRIPVIGKHFPGHGYVTGDSHEVLPIDDRSIDEIIASDLQPFAKLASMLDAVMPAHIVYSKVDDKPAGFSRFWLQDILRQKLGFNGLIVTDDLTMQGAAAFGSYCNCAEMALDAGSDIIIVCNSRKGVIEILDGIKVRNNSELLRKLNIYRRFI